MKTKTIFEPSDFESGGQMIIRNNAPLKIKDFYAVSNLVYKIGWLAFRGSEEPCLVMISMTDGMIFEPMSEQKLCDHLNNDQYGYRPLTKEEISGIMGEIGNRF